MNKSISLSRNHDRKVFLLMLALVSAALLAACSNNQTERTLGVSTGLSAADETTTATVTGTVTTTQTLTVTTTRTATMTATSSVTGTPTMTMTPQATVTALDEKVTICHRTGSSQNPYVQITVSSNAVPAHSGHGDLIPAPAGGCPAVAGTATVGGTTTPPATQTPQVTSTAAATGTPQGTAIVQENKVTICHATSSTQNPYVLITISENALPAHRAHGDIVPAPAAGCPAPQQKSVQKQTPKQEPQKQKPTKQIQKDPQPAPKQDQEKQKPDKPEKPGKNK
ncbi:MAG: hypothetical protein ABI670_03505 [Chloroflexota bacterium]